MIHNLTGGQWGLLIRRVLEAGALTIVPLAVLFVPMALGLKTLYPWMDHGSSSRPTSRVKHKASYLNADAFLIRAAVYFVVWIVLASLLNVAAARRDRTGTAPGSARRD